MENIQSMIDRLEGRIEVRTQQRDDATSEAMIISINGELAAMRIQLAALINSQNQGKFPPPVSVPVFSHSLR